jgi:hypothetical protein
MSSPAKSPTKSLKNSPRKHNGTNNGTKKNAARVNKQKVISIMLAQADLMCNDIKTLGRNIDRERLSHYIHALTQQKVHKTILKKYKKILRNY